MAASQLRHAERTGLVPHCTALPPIPLRGVGVTAAMADHLAEHFAQLRLERRGAQHKSTAAGAQLRRRAAALAQQRAARQARTQHARASAFVALIRADAVLSTPPGDTSALMQAEALEALPLPSELAQWIARPEPPGERCLVVGAHGHARAMRPCGSPMLAFNSALPGARRAVPGYTLLDCVLAPGAALLHVLDVLAWNAHDCDACDTDFRMFWLVTKLVEEPDVAEVSTHNDYALRAVPSFPVTLDALSALERACATYNASSVYLTHCETPYVNGANPLHCRAPISVLPALRLALTGSTGD